jgi:hypothetical protein
LRIFGQASSFEDGISEFKDHVQAVSKLIGENSNYNETSVITMLLQKVFEERKMYQSGKDPRPCEIMIKPSEVEYHYSGNIFGWCVFSDGTYEFYFQKNA